MRGSAFGACSSALTGERTSSQNNKKGSVPVGPEHTVEMAIPLLVEPRHMLPQNCLQGVIKQLNLAEGGRL